MVLLGCVLVYLLVVIMSFRKLVMMLGWFVSMFVLMVSGCGVLLLLWIECFG